ncbi:transposase [Acetobacter aceti NRIC 0242]|uniref:Transposase n=1 Tax=Acetobacter aceti NBRC 14818 TaxID=887700 RepID=A0AB33IGM3_ACEAC|nr:transposase domain-containing protein [Acetobacter aceti]TCS31769.1 Mu DNA binding protein [Acetobacter aceti NBRC 14818]BCK77188.1 hypothetical protein EMQ_2794 [Acetobacter aceti NBRC 14818]GAN58876.1 Mu-like prophage FluMu transposase A [Acetobacter aceti NBRC 14818]GBO80656.1 transposase [Acetobacter aceti NRIC 0242]
MLTREWATIREFSEMGLPMIPDRRALQISAEKNRWDRSEYRNRYWRRRDASGGGNEYHYMLLNRMAQLEWVKRFSVISVDEERAQVSEEDHRYDEEWRRFHEASEGKKEKALAHLAILDRYHRLCEAGLTKEEAMNEVRLRENPQVSRSTFMSWRRLIAQVPRNHWLPCLLPRYRGRTEKRAACSEEAFEAMKSLYLQPEGPTLEKCYRDVQEMAEEHGWTIPSLKTFSRWIDKLPEMTVVMARKGRVAANEMIPFQERTVAHMHALQAVTADGHKWDVFVRWPDGKVARPLMVAWQDIYSRMILSWRVERSESADLIQLAYGDMVEKYGIPDKAYLDNGRAFASKQMTGGKKTRFRFTYQEDEIRGVMTILGTEPIFVTPYSGRSKPIERAFLDFTRDIAKDIRFAGAY